MLTVRNITNNKHRHLRIRDVLVGFFTIHMVVIVLWSSSYYFPTRCHYMFTVPQSDERYSYIHVFNVLMSTICIVKTRHMHIELYSSVINKSMAHIKIPLNGCALYPSHN